MLSKDELWEWCQEMVDKYNIAFFYLLNQFELQSAFTGSHEKAMRNIERSLQRDNG